MNNSELYAMLYFIGAILAALVVSVILCRHRIARNKKSFYLPVIAGTVVANTVFFLAVFLSGRIYVERWRIFKSQAWQGFNSLEGCIFDAMLFIGIGTFICIFPMLAVAFYYERQCKRNKMRVTQPPPI